MDKEEKTKEVTPPKPEAESAVPEADPKTEPEAVPPTAPNVEPKAEPKTQSLLGKKIFFLYPPSTVQNQVITELTQNEFEVYILKDHTRLLRALKKYPDSIVYVNIDEVVSKLEWIKWIGTTCSAMPEIKVGVFTANTDDKVKDEYMSKLKIAAGYFMVKLDMHKIASAIIEVLNVMNVKGRRKYLRANIPPENPVNMNIPNNGEFVKGTVRDISVVGFSCILESGPSLKNNELIRDIQIKLQSSILKVEAVVFGSRIENTPEGEQKIYVLLFTQRVDPEVKVKIRKYIQNNLQSKMDAELK